MNVGAVGAVGGGTTAVYAVLSPYLNGVVRTSDAAAAAELQAAAVAKSAAATAAAIAARSDAAGTIAAAPPFVNPAITAIADRIALGEALTQPGAVTPNALLGTATTGTTAAATPLALATTADVAASTTATTALTTVASATTPTAASTIDPQPSPTDQVLYGDSGLLIQSYGAVALIAGLQSVPPIYTQPVTPAIPPAPPVTALPRPEKVA